MEAFEQLKGELEESIWNYQQQIGSMQMEEVQLVREVEQLQKRHDVVEGMVKKLGEMVSEKSFPTFRKGGDGKIGISGPSHAAACIQALAKLPFIESAFMRNMLPAVKNAKEDSMCGILRMYLHEMWNGKYTGLEVWELERMEDSIRRRCHHYSSYDSCELYKRILECLHFELNEAEDHSTIPQFPESSDLEETYKWYLVEFEKRHKSVIHDQFLCFHGYKLTCQECKYQQCSISPDFLIKVDPPSVHSEKKVRVAIILKNQAPKKYGFKLKENETVGDLRRMIAKVANQADHPERFIIYEIFHQRLHTCHDDSFKASGLYENDEIYAIECDNLVPGIHASYQHLGYSPCICVAIKWDSISNSKPSNYDPVPFLLSYVPGKTTHREIYEDIIEAMKRFQTEEGIEIVLPKTKSSVVDPSVVDSPVVDPSVEDPSVEDAVPPAHVETPDFDNAQELTPSTFSNDSLDDSYEFDPPQYEEQVSKSPFNTNNDESEHLFFHLSYSGGKFPLNDDVGLFPKNSHGFSHGYSRTDIPCLTISPRDQEKFIEIYDFQKLKVQWKDIVADPSTQDIFKPPKIPTLNECFRKEYSAEYECCKCKCKKQQVCHQIMNSPRIAAVKMDIIRTDSNSRTRKDVSIDHPMFNMKLKPLNNSKNVYHLRSAIHHLGGIGLGHFMAYVKVNSSNGHSGWAKFDDLDYQTIPQNSVVTDSSYMLIYARGKKKKNLEPILEKTQPDDQLVTVRFGNNSTFSIIVQPKMTIFEFKELFDKYQGVVPEDQMFGYEGKELKDEKTFQDYDIKDGATIYFRRIPQSLKDMNYIPLTNNMENPPAQGEMRILFRAGGKIYMLDIAEDATVDDLKQLLLSHMSGGGSIRLVYNSQELYDNRTLMSYGIQQGSTVFHLTH